MLPPSRCEININISTQSNKKIGAHCQQLGKEGIPEAQLFFLGLSTARPMRYRIQSGADYFLFVCLKYSK
jgi:hypothetical protein